MIVDIAQPLDQFLEGRRFPINIEELIPDCIKNTEYILRVNDVGIGITALYIDLGIFSEILWRSDLGDV